MFAKRLFQKAMLQPNVQHERTILPDLDLHVSLHYGIPNTASILAFDPIQRLLAVGTLDGRIKVIGGDNIEGLLISPKKVPYKYLEFIHNQGFLVGVSNENDIQVWNLDSRQLIDSLKWTANITAFAVIHGTFLMYVGDENGLLSVVKYEDGDGKILKLPYHIPADAMADAAGVTFPGHQSIVGVLLQPDTSGTRVLIAYESGLLALWDVADCQVVTLRGHTDLQLKAEGITGSQTVDANELEDNGAFNEQEQREICSLCWVSSTGSVLAVGYTNGDILLWNMSQNTSMKEQQVGLSANNVVKLQLTSGNRRLPVIVLHWSENSKPNDAGQLFIYGGDEIGSDEILTVLNLEWSSGIETLRCISRLELGLNGSFADMILIPSAGSLQNNSTAAIFVLTNPGQLEVYDGALLSMLKPEEGKPPAHPEKFPVVVPTIDPCLTVTKLCLLPKEKSFKALLERVLAKRTGVTHTLSAGSKWPLTGGVPSELLSSESFGVEKIYVAGYQDGSVRMWDATYSVLLYMFTLEGKVTDVELDGETASVSALDFCSINLTLAVGNACGLVRVYRLQENTDDSSFHFVSGTKREVRTLHHTNGFPCIAAFSVINSEILALQFTKSGDKLAVGFQSGQVAMLDMRSQSIIFCTECISGIKSPVISISIHVVPQKIDQLNSPTDSSSKSSKDPEEVAFILTKDAHVIAVDIITGNKLSSRPMHPKKESAAISMYVLEGSNATNDAISEKHTQHPSDESSMKSEPVQKSNPSGSKAQVGEPQYSSEASISLDLLQDPLLLLVSEDALRLYSLNSVIQGNNSYLHKVNLLKHCCWSTTFKKKDEIACGLILLYQTGVFEVRSLPDFEVLAESSLMSILRWSFKTDTNKTMSSYNSGQITMVNGNEVAFLSLVACENDFRLPESLPCLHDKVLAAAADAAISLSTNQKKRQNTTPGIIGGLIRGLKGDKAEKDTNSVDKISRTSFTEQLEVFFSRVPFSDPSATMDGQENELTIDDIEIDEKVPVATTSSLVNKSKGKGEKTEREKLFQGATSDVKPRVRTTQEILTKYKFGGDASAAAAHAKDKLAQRQEKLQHISERTAEMQNRAEDFASLAHELVKTMEKKKWWQI